MAITKIFPKRQRLDHLLAYITDVEKTAGSTLVTGINCAPETAHESMSASFALNDKPLRVQGYHVIQSFAPDEVDASIAHRIGVELAERLWGENFQAVVATHLNTNVFHNHIVICSTSFIDGHRYHSCKKSYRQIREVSDSLCREHQLSVIDKPRDAKYKSQAELVAERKGQPTWKSLIKADIDEVITRSISIHQFSSNLKGMGYEIKAGKDISVRPQGKERFVRLARNFGKDYTYERICERILKNGLMVVASARPRPDSPRPEKLPPVPKGSIAALHRHYLYLFGYYQKQGTSSNARMHYLLREDIARLDAIIADERMLSSNGIETTSQLQAHYHHSLRAVEELTEERKPLYCIARNSDGAPSVDKAKERIASINTNLKELRRTLRQCDRIAERSGSLLERIECIERSFDLFENKKARHHVSDRIR